jgi:hypothetical protein
MYKESKVVKLRNREQNAGYQRLGRGADEEMLTKGNKISTIQNE